MQARGPIAEDRTCYSLTDGDGVATERPVRWKGLGKTRKGPPFFYGRWCAEARRGEARRDAAMRCERNRRRRELDQGGTHDLGRLDYCI